MASTTIIILMLFFTQGSLGHVLPQSSIVGIAGGHSVNIEDTPFMAALLHVDTRTNDTEFLCGGSIIHKQFVLTSARCSMLSPISVRTGSPRYNEGGQLYQVEKCITHESYSFVTNKNNVGLLKLSEPVTFSPSVAMVRLADGSVDIPAGLFANVSGWGDTESSYEPSRDLQQVTVTVSPPNACNKFYRYSEKMTDKQICVYKRGKGACFDDRGAPLTAGDIQIGVGHDADLNGVSCWGALNVYEKVAPHLQWIHNKIDKNH